MIVKKETKVLLESKGYIFDQRIITTYNNNEESDDHGLTQSFVQDWLRNEKHLHVDIYLGSKTFKWEINNWIIDLKHEKKIKWPLPVKIYESYEEALEVCLQEIIKLL